MLDRVKATQQEGMIQLFAAAKCHMTPSWVKRFMKQIKRLKSLLQRCGSACLQDGGDSRQWIANIQIFYSPEMVAQR